MGINKKGRENKFSLEVAVGMNNTVVTPTLMYTSETWQISKSQMFKFRAVETKYFRDARGVALRNSEK